jgi:predicted transcriptional regulator
MSSSDFKNKTNDEIKHYLRIKILKERNKLELTQKEFAKLASIPLRTYKRFEYGCDGSFDNFINILRAFEKLRIIEAIFLDELPHKSNILEIIESARVKSLSRG